MTRGERMRALTSICLERRSRTAAPWTQTPARCHCAGSSVPRRGTYRIRNIDQVVVKGKTEPVSVYEVLDHHTDETFPNIMDVVSYFNEGTQHYRAARFEKAIGQFSKALGCNPNDKLSALYVERCRHLSKHPPGESWNGVWIMNS